MTDTADFDKYSDWTEYRVPRGADIYAVEKNEPSREATEKREVRRNFRLSGHKRLAVWMLPEAPEVLKEAEEAGYAVFEYREYFLIIHPDSFTLIHR